MHPAYAMKCHYVCYMQAKLFHMIGPWLSETTLIKWDGLAFWIESWEEQNDMIPKNKKWRWFVYVNHEAYFLYFWFLNVVIKNHPVFFYRRARQRCFWLLAFISRPQVRNIHLPGRMILSGSLIPSDKYFLKNVTFVVRNPLVWLRHHSCQTLYVARVKSNN